MENRLKSFHIEPSCCDSPQLRMSDQYQQTLADNVFGILLPSKQSHHMTQEMISLNQINISSLLTTSQPINTLHLITNTQSVENKLTC
jgi:hypothetical protein